MTGDRTAADAWIRAHVVRSGTGLRAAAHGGALRALLPPTDPWFGRLRDAYLEPWGRGLVGAFAVAIRVGTFAHAFAWARQRDALPEAARAAFDKVFAIVLRRAVARTLE
jgi:hypothetical protein